MPTYFANKPCELCSESLLELPPFFFRVNPLGLQVSYFRVDQAFEEGKQ